MGAARAIKTVAEAARLARDGDLIEVDAGDYLGDVAVWPQDELRIVAIGGRVRLDAGGAAAEGKGIWVVRGGRIAVQGFDFSNAAAPGRNGAGIRFESGWLALRDCSFMHNEMGLLAGNDATAVLEVEDCEFAHNFRPDGHNHNLYAGRIARLSVAGCYLHHARTGHLLKSRAAFSDIRYSRLTDEHGGRASYELEFPNGGIARVIGCIIAQGAQTENPALISFGAEGYFWSANELYLANNTLLDRPGRAGMPLKVWPGAAQVRAINNLLVGASSFATAGASISERDNAGIERAAFERQSDSDFRLRPGSRLIGRLPVRYAAQDERLAPAREYLHPRGSAALKRPAHNPGAMQSLASRPS